MSLTLQQRRDWVEALGMVYYPNKQLTPQVIDLNLQWSRNDEYKKDIRINEFYYRKQATVADGDFLPADFVNYADEAFYSNAGTDTSLTLIQAQSLPFGRTGNSLLKGLAGQPIIYFANQKINTIPTLSGITFSYYWKPADLFNPTSPVAGSTTDNMPGYLEPAIVRGAAERNLVIMAGREQAMEIMHLRAGQAAEVNQTFYERLVDVSARSTRTSLR